MLSSISFETGKRSQTQSSVKTTRWSETANGSLVLSEIGTTAERPTHAEKNLKEFTPALLPSASGELCPLDKDLSWKSAYRPCGSVPGTWTITPFIGRLHESHLTILRQSRAKR